MLGSEAEGYVWDATWDEEEDEDPRNKLARLYGCTPQDVLAIKVDVEDEEESMSEASADGYYIPADDYADDLDMEDKYFDEAEETIKRAIKEHHSEETAAIELHALKMAYNMTFHDLRAACFPVLLKAVHDEASEAGAKVCFKFKIGVYIDVVKILNKWAPLMKRFCNSDSDQQDLLRIALVRSFLPDHIN